MKLQTKFLLWMSALVGLVVSGVGALTVLSERQLLKREMADHHRTLVTSLAKVAEESLFQDDLVFFNFLKTVRSERGFVSAALIDSRGVVKMHSDVGAMGQPTTVSPAEQSLGRSEVVSAVSVVNGRRLRHYSTPVWYGASRIGTARLTLSDDAIRAVVNDETNKTLRRIGIITGGMLLLGFIGVLVGAKTLIRPIHDVVSGMDAVAAGRRDPIPEPARHDEFGWMVRQLNVMITRLREGDEMKRDFAAGVTHELRSPLVAIQGLINRLIKDAGRYDAATQQDFLLTVHNNTDRLMKLIDDLLLAARIEAHHEDIHPTPFDFRPVADEMIKLFQPLALQKNIDLRLDVPPALRVTADHDKVIHVLMNLLSNALKFTVQGSVTLRARDVGSQVQIEVSDTGPGVAAGDREKIFEKFFRSRSNDKGTKGTGLGLYIVQRLVEAHGGRIWVDERPGRGSTFCFTLPRSSRTDIPPLVTP